MGKPRKLTPLQDRFVDAIVSPDVKSATQAAIQAGYSPITAPELGSLNLRKPYVVAAIEERKRECEQFANITANQVLGATARRAYATVDDALDADGNFDIKKARKTGAIHLVKKLTKTHTQHGTNVAVEFYSNESAQDKLGQYLGMEKQAAMNPADVGVIAAEIADRLVSQGVMSVEEARERVLALYPELVSKAVN